jgi:hypothetical protein
MKRSLIAVCLLLLSPSSVMACIEDHNTGAGWFDQQPSGWTTYGTGAQALHRDRLLDVALFAGGLGAVILMGVAYRATCLAPRRAPMSPSQPGALVPLALPIDAPAFEPLCAEPWLDIDAQDWPSPRIVDVHSSSITGHAHGIDSIMSIGALT